MAAAVSAVLLLAFVSTVPFAGIPLPGTEAFLPAYAAAVMVSDLVTAALLVSMFVAGGSLGLLLLSICYLFAGVTAIPWALTFPGVFAPSGLLGAGLQTTAYIAAIRRLAFPLFVIAYALFKDRCVAGGHARSVVWSVALTTAAVIALTSLIIASDNAMPKLMLDERSVTSLWSYVSEAGTLAHILAIIVLWRRFRSTLDLWLLIVLGTMLLEFVMLTYISGGRLSLGWWAGRVYGLAAATLVMLILLLETSVLHSRLIRSVSIEKRARDARLLTMEALSASIAHEVNQPISSMVTNANACIRWLDRESPELERARSTLGRIVADGHRVGAIIEGIRAMFREERGPRESVDINRLIQDAVRDLGLEARLNGVDISLTLDPALPRVNANVIQLRQVIDNLVANAIEAMDGKGECVVRISTAGHPDEVTVLVEDTGIGIPEDVDRLFDPFVTTKMGGLGMGLMICRSIVEAHGGQLSVHNNVPKGAVFRFSLPTYHLSDSRDGESVR
ncbi:sensor histidine kinase [Flaviflagellibacter deserti]|uniref:histidine kinase n=2 Tax=Flaviflagellibacter deserti TaxID=2267266 RepID=A0ABV9YWN2_9HYPH